MLAQSITFTEEKLKSSLKKIQSNINFAVHSVIYYPYHFFHYDVKAKRIFLPKNEEVGCTVEPVSGIGSLIDYTPKLSSVEISIEKQVPQTYTLEECRTISESFIYQSISLKMKMLSISELIFKYHEFFYRPYWVVTSNNPKEVPDFIVDAVTGQYHPL